MYGEIHLIKGSFCNTLCNYMYCTILSWIHFCATYIVSCLRHGYLVQNVYTMCNFTLVALFKFTHHCLDCRQELSQMNHDLEARLAQLEKDNLHFTEQVASLTGQLSTAQQEGQLANRLLEEARNQLEDRERQQNENVWDSHVIILCHTLCLREPLAF